jgi:hypothetical protein
MISGAVEGCQGKPASTFPDRAEISKTREINLENVATLQCGIGKFSRLHAILSWRFELG